MADTPPESYAEPSTRMRATAPQGSPARRPGVRLVWVALVLGLVGVGLLAGPFQRRIKAENAKLAYQARVQARRITLTEEEQIMAEEFAKALLQAVERQDTAAIDARVDFEYLIDDIFHGFEDPAQMKPRILETMRKNPGGFFFNNVLGETGRFVRHRTRDGVPAITLRCGASYIDILLLRLKNGGFKVIDMYNYTFGIQLGEYTRQMVAIMMDAGGDPVVQVLGEAGKMTDMEPVAKMTRASRDRRPEEVISTYHDLSPEAMNRPNVFMLYLRALHVVKGPYVEEYAKAVEKAPSLLGPDAKIDLLLFERHVLRRDFVAARQAAEACIQTIGEDSRLFYQLGMMCVRTNDIPAAKEALKKAEAIEPDLFDLVDLKMQIRAVEKDYAGLVNAIHAFKARTGATITPDRLTEPVYDDFKKSPEFTAWNATVKKSAP